MSEFKVIETQEDFDAAIKDRIERLNKKHEEEITGLKEFESKNKALEQQIAELNQKYSGFDEKVSEYDAKISALNEEKDKINGLLSEKDATIRKYELDRTRLSVAAEFNIPTNAINFIQGESEDDLRESAKQLKAVINVKEPRIAIPPSESTKDSDKSSYLAFKQMSEELN